MKIKRGILRVFLLAAGIFLQVSSSILSAPVQALADAPFQARLPIILKGFVFGDGTVTGSVINASLQTDVPGAQVCWRSHCVFSNSGGEFVLDNVASGHQILTASKDGFVSNDQDVYVVGNGMTHQNIAIIPDVAISGVKYRILTTWDPQTCWPDPNGSDCWDNDLDVHMWLAPGPPAYHIGYYFHYNPLTDIEEYWLDKGDCYQLFPNACLERDARYGYGPETVAIKRRENILTYHFGVLNYNQGQPGVPEISHTTAKVQVYDITGLLRAYNIPVNGGDRNFWYVFSMDGTSGEITDQNCIMDYTNAPPVCP